MNRNLLLIFVFIYAAFSNSVNAQENLSDTLNKNKLTDLHLFFDYDQVEYYYTNYDPLQAHKNYEYLGKTKLDTLKRNVIYGHIPSDSQDVFFFENYEKIGYGKKWLDTATFKYLNSVFIKKDSVNYSSNRCINVYRDILVFRKNEKVTGIVKICFECNGYLIYGAKVVTNSFGFKSDFEMLKKILRR